jgi:hypothetical protein
MLVVPNTSQEIGFFLVIAMYWHNAKKQKNNTEIPEAKLNIFFPVTDTLQPFYFCGIFITSTSNTINSS